MMNHENSFCLLRSGFSYRFYCYIRREYVAIERKRAKIFNMKQLISGSLTVSGTSITMLVTVERIQMHSTNLIGFWKNPITRSFILNDGV
jgi:hypothetical protein